MTDTFLVNGLYPLQYFTEAGVDQIQYPNQYWWSSKQRYAAEKSSGGGYQSLASGGVQSSEYLEIDLGRVREVGYLNMQILRAPIDIFINYDTVSAITGAQDWVAVNRIDGMPFDNKIFYDADSKNAFYDAEFYFEDALGQTVKTRFLRIKFARRDEEWPHKGAAAFRWPIIVKSLKTAHAIADYSDTLGVAYDTEVPAAVSDTLIAMSSSQANDTSVITGPDYVCQQFALPQDFMRIDISPNLLGMSVLVDISANDSNVLPQKETEASLGWELWQSGVNGDRTLSKVFSGVKTGTSTDGHAWFDIEFPEPVETDEGDITTRQFFEFRFKSLSVHDSLGRPVLANFLTQDNASLGFYFDGGATMINAGHGMTPVSHSDRFVLSGDQTNFIQDGDIIRRVDRFGDFEAVVSSFDYNVTNANQTTIFLVDPWQGPSGTNIPIERLLGLRNGVSASTEYDISATYRVYADVVDVGRDVLGNSYRYGTRIQEPQNVIDNVTADLHTPGWLSEPQPSPDAVEAMYFDVRWQDNTNTYQPAVIDAIKMTPRTNGINMHIYYCDQHLQSDRPENRNMWDKLVWTPINTTYQINGKMNITLPTSIKAGFIKLEFTKLQPRPFKVPSKPELPPTKFHRYPTWIELQFQNSLVRRTVQDWFVKQTGAVKFNALQFMANPILEFEYKEREFLAALATNKKPAQNVINSGLINTATNTFIDPVTGSKIQVHTNSMFKSPLSLAVNRDSILGQQIGALAQPTQRLIVREGGFNASRSTVPNVSTQADRVSESFGQIAQTPMWFNQEGRHIYKVDQAKFNKKAYFAGVQSVEFLRKDYTLARDDQLIVENLWDDQMLDENTWELDNPSLLSQLVTDNPPINVLVTYTVDDVTYTDEAHSFTSPSTDIVLLNSGLTQAINITMYQTVDGTTHSSQFFLGKDFDQQTFIDQNGNYENHLSVDVQSERLVVGHVASTYDSATVTATAIVSGTDS